MKLICPSCNSKIDSQNINIKKGIGHCQNCSEIIKLADHLHSNEEIRRSEKPFFTKISFSKSSNNFVIKIPPKGLSAKSTLLPFISLAIFFLIFLFMINQENEALKSLTLNNFFEKIQTIPLTDLITGHTFFYFMIPFVIIPPIWSIILKTQLIINKKETTVTWNFLGIPYSKTNNTADLKKITEDVVYNQNYQPVYGISLIFKRGKKITFGSKLTEEERKWLIGELYEIKDSFNFSK